jgi:thiol-disulfide isomerase/thioredoxin
MPERLVVLAVVALLVAVGVLVVRRYAAAGAERVMAGPGAPLWASLGVQPDGRATLVTFSTPSCAACHNAQAPAVSKVEQQLGGDGLRVIRVDAAEQPEVARAFGVLTVPATVVLAQAGHVVAVNQGFAPTVKLVEQLQRA